MDLLGREELVDQLDRDRALAAWTLMPSIYLGDPNRCMVGKTFVRVMWSNGLTAYPTGEEVGAPVAASYRALYKLPNGRTLAIAPT